MAQPALNGHDDWFAIDDSGGKVKNTALRLTWMPRTMSIAPVLYGVTMQEPGVSKLVSVRFGAA